MKLTWTRKDFDADIDFMRRAYEYISQNEPELRSKIKQAEK